MTPQSIPDGVARHGAAAHPDADDEPSRRLCRGRPARGQREACGDHGKRGCPPHRHFAAGGGCGALDQAAKSGFAVVALAA